MLTGGRSRSSVLEPGRPGHRGGSTLASRSHAPMTEPADRPPIDPTLMTVHAHPDDETIGTGGTMAKAVAEGRRVVLVTCTRGEMGEIVVPDLDTPDNHRRLGELRAGELERAMGRLGVTEWENLGYHDSDMMGRAGNLDPRNFWQADLDEAAGRLIVAHPPLPARCRHDLQRVRRVRPPRPHPDPRRDGARLSASRRSGLVPASSWRREHGGTGPADRRTAAWRRGRPRSCTSRPSRPRSASRCRDRMEEAGEDEPWQPPKDATPEQLAEFEAFQAKMLVPDELVTTWIELD